MFAASPNAFLRVGHARRIPERLLLREKNRDKLIHACIGEKQIRRVGQQRGRRHNRVLFLAKEIEKGLADFGGGHHVDLTIKLPERPQISKWKS